MHHLASHGAPWPPPASPVRFRFCPQASASFHPKVCPLSSLAFLPAALLETFPSCRLQRGPSTFSHLHHFPSLEPHREAFPPGAEFLAFGFHSFPTCTRHTHRHPNTAVLRGSTQALVTASLPLLHSERVGCVRAGLILPRWPLPIRWPLGGYPRVLPLLARKVRGAGSSEKSLLARLPRSLPHLLSIFQSLPTFICQKKYLNASPSQSFTMEQYSVERGALLNLFIPKT